MRKLLLKSVPLLFTPLVALAVGYGWGDERRPCTAAERELYQSLLQQAVYAEWEPPVEDSTYSCELIIALNFRGEVNDVAVEGCSDDHITIRKSVEDAAYSASPLPLPENRTCFERKVRVRVTHRAPGES